MTWAVPSWYALVLLGLAAFRTWRLLAEDVILDPVRDRVASGAKTAKFLACAYCAGFWIALAWWLAWIAWPHWTLIVAAPAAISALVGLVASISSD